MIIIFAYMDLFFIYSILEPIMHKLQMATGNNNLWWAKKWFDSVNVVYFIIALFLIFCQNQVFMGIFILIVSVINICLNSIVLWKYSMKKTGKKHIRHPIQREKDKIMYYLYRGKRNPLELSLMRSRMFNVFFVIIFMTIIVFLYAYSATFLFFALMMGYMMLYTLWLYIRSCTPMLPSKSKKAKVSQKTGLTLN